MKEPREQKLTGDSGAVGIQAGFRRRGHLGVSRVSPVPVWKRGNVRAREQLVPELQGVAYLLPSPGA